MTYPVDSVIQPSNNRGLVFIYPPDIINLQLKYFFRNITLAQSKQIGYFDAGETAHTH